MSDDKQLIHETIANADSITVLTGAGVSTDSGIPDFKTMDREWAYPETREEIFSREFFYAHPERFWDIYRTLFNVKIAAEPNPFHKYLVSLEDSHNVTIITQNIDGLHTQAGSSRVLEVHGNNHELMDSAGQIYPVKNDGDKEYPRNESGEILRPNAVFFGESPRHMDEAQRILENDTDLLIVAGTSLRVYPVAFMPYQVADGVPSIWLNNHGYPGEYFFTYYWAQGLQSFIEGILE